MRLEQLRFLCEIVDREYSISRAAEALNTSQPGVSKQIRLLEQELKFEILLRRRGRIAGLTEPGASVVRIARKMLRDAGSIGSLRDDLMQRDGGELVIATTHLHAQHVLPAIVERFRRNYPRVQFSLLQANPDETLDLVSSGRADIGITGDTPGSTELVQLPCYDLKRSLILPRGHPLLRERKLTLAKIARHPQIAYDRSYPGGMALHRAFEARGITPDIIINAIDSEVIKAYVRIGLGIAVVPTVAFERSVEKTLAAVDVTGLFGVSSAFVVLHPEAYLRTYMYDFIAMLGPRWTRARIEAVVARGSGSAPKQVRWRKSVGRA